MNPTPYGRPVYTGDSISQTAMRSGTKAAELRESSTKYLMNFTLYAEAGSDVN
jgi:hypothetical protein